MDSRHEEIARCLFRESNDALFVFDPQDNRVVDVNPTALRLTGFDGDYLCGLTLPDLFTSLNVGGINRLIQAYRRTGFYHSREGFFLGRETGDPIPVNVSVSRIHTSPEPLGLVVARDVSERVRDQNALRESESRYRGLVETAKVLIWSATSDGVIRSLNPAFETVTGLLRSDWIGRHFKELIHPDDCAGAMEAFGKALRSERVLPFEVRVGPASESGPVIEVLSTSPHTLEGLPGLTGVARDVTERKRASEALERAEAERRAKEMAEAADRAKSEFLGNISHEIRTPMTAILGFTDLLLEDERVRALPPAVFDSLLTIKRNGTHLLDLINDILDLTKIERKELRIDLMRVNTSRVVQDVAVTLQGAAEAKGLALTVEVAVDAPSTLCTDRMRLRQILTNLVNNAVKFTEHGGVRIVVDRIDGFVRFAVVDTGVGVPFNEMERVFEVFYTRDNRATRDSGLGLGLAITKRLVGLLGGKISVRSQPGGGSVFEFTLPADEADEVWNSESGSGLHKLLERPLAETPYLGGRVLIAEDNESISKFLAYRLGKSGSEVAIAQDGQEALDLALASHRSGKPFDWVLMDLQMPKLDGFEATRQLRREGYRGPIIALTAYANNEHKEECLRFGCDDHISKPVDWPRLVEVLNRHRGKLSDASGA